MDDAITTFNFKVIYRKGSSKEAGYLSRNPVVLHREEAANTSAEAYINYVTSYCSVPKSMTLAEIKDATVNDPVLTKVKTSLKEGKWDENDHDLKPLDFALRNVSEDIPLKNTRLLIPTTL